MNEMVEWVAQAMFERWAERPKSQTQVWDALTERGRDHAYPVNTQRS